ncbi:MAG: cupin domain-containing protein [Candidatus Tyrphobacter sp.]
MKHRSFLALCLILSLPALVAAAPAPTIYTPGSIHWTPAPGMGPGVQMATLFGNPSSSGRYVFRLRLRDGATFGPHFHNDTERVTVISGTLLVGLGDTLNRARMTALPAGSIVSIPAGVHHYAIARGTTVLQLDGSGPFRMTEVRSQH